MLKKDYKNDFEYIIKKDKRTDYIVRKCNDKAGYYIIGYDHNAIMAFDLYFIFNNTFIGDKIPNYFDNLTSAVKFLKENFNNII